MAPATGDGTPRGGLPATHYEGVQMMAKKEYQKRGYVYVLSNPSMPGIVKIGRSKSGEKHRAQQMYTTGVPEPFVLEFEILTNDAEDLEATVHEEMAQYRTNGSREFFSCEVEVAVIRVVECWAYSASRVLVPFEIVWDDGDLNLLAHRVSESIGRDIHPFEMHQAIEMEMTVDLAKELWAKHQKRLRARLERTGSLSPFAEEKTIQ
jgi:nuclear transport factor 2 (NTF2) superfamily protein